MKRFANYRVGVGIILLLAGVGVVQASEPGSGDLDPVPEKPESSKRIGWGGLWLITGRPVYDDVTAVVGGAEGSAALMIQRPRVGETRWIFLHGRSLYCSVYGETPTRFANIRPGQYITSRKYYDWDPNYKEMNRRRLNGLLEQLNVRAGKLYTPFLTGKGWGSTGNVVGATRDQAESAVTRLGLTLELLGQQSVGRVVRQVPAAGSPITVGQPVWVELDGTAPAAGRTPGDDSGDPIQLQDSDNGSELQEEITAEYGNDHGAGDCGGNGLDLVWKLPASADGTTVTARRVGWDGDKITLSGWNGAKNVVDCDYARNAEIEFTATADSYVIVDRTSPGWVEVVISWE